MKYIKFLLKLLLALLIIWVIRDKIKFEQLDFILSNPFLSLVAPYNHLIVVLYNYI